MSTLRRAVVTGARDAAQVAAYLPSNYRIFEERYTQAHGAAERTLVDVTIEGHDNAGWTLSDYVRPRLASGLMGCTEIEVTQ